MSSTVLNAIERIGKEKHGVGSLNNWGTDIVNLGAVVADEAIDNWEVVELDFNEKGERICRVLSDVSKAGYLIASVEDYLDDYETISNFFNAKGERARIVKFVEGKRFETSKYKLDDEAKPVKNGQKVHWDVDAKAYIISNGVSENAGYADAGNKFVVVDANGNYLDGQHTIRFEVVKSATL